MATVNTSKLTVTLERYNRKGSSDSFFFRIAEAVDFNTETIIPIEALKDAGAIGWNTSGFAGIQAHFDTGSQAFAVIEILDTDETYVDSNGVQRERINFRLITDLTVARRAADIQAGLKMLDRAQSTARKSSRFVTKSSGKSTIQQQIDELISQGVPTAKTDKDAYDKSLSKLQAELQEA
jgi:hypothetical protein